MISVGLIFNNKRIISNMIQFRKIGSLIFAVFFLFNSIAAQRHCAQHWQQRMQEKSAGVPSSIAGCLSGDHGAAVYSPSISVSPAKVKTYAGSGHKGFSSEEASYLSCCCVNCRFAEHRVEEISFISPAIELTETSYLPGFSQLDPQVHFPPPWTA